ncbi:iron-containing alcohol dehydrogenase [Neobacillus cucumis]|uniref:iron-containing alcohol dehydrogenase family protein n=1 Tax=Neobacillus cucumis TaxID=1740721 RepID=UPI0018E03865|nr:iron-containing alcohol dehydrogenase [Neobacillus cucumis]MBI0579861.1 iron-containing alcohol dehydrogenase [Neobacillus cucumis]
MSYTIFSPSRILFGEGSINKLSEVVQRFNAKKVILITDQGIKKAGIVDRVLQVLDTEVIDVVIFDQTKPEPTVKNYEDALKLAKLENIELVIGLGGGSSLDLAKAVALSMVHEESILSFVGIDKVPSPGLPTIMISTTSGTGSEVSKFAVLTDEETNLKSVICSPHVLASFAIVDPGLTLSLPPVITAHTGIDALVHAIEGYLAVRSAPYTDQLALNAFEKIWNHLSSAYKNGNDIEARTEMSMGSMLGGLVLNTTDGAAMVHGLAFSLGVYCHLSHGLSNSLVLPYVLEVIAPLRQEKVLKLAKIAGIERDSVQETINAFIEAIVELQQRIDLPTTLKELNISQDLLPVLANSSYGMERLQSNSPKRLSEQEILDIFQRALHGELLLKKVEQ